MIDAYYRASAAGLQFRFNTGDEWRLLDGEADGTARFQHRAQPRLRLQISVLRSPANDGTPAERATARLRALRAQFPSHQVLTPQPPADLDWTRTVPLFGGPFFDLRYTLQPRTPPAADAAAAHTAHFRELHGQFAQYEIILQYSVVGSDMGPAILDALQTASLLASCMEIDSE